MYLKDESRDRLTNTKDCRFLGDIIKDQDNYFKNLKVLDQNIMFWAFN